MGSARLLVAALGVLAVGTVVRSLPSVICLFAGTVILSAAIAFGNVLLPALIILGILHDTTHSWTLPLTALAALGLATAVAGHGAGQDRHIHQP
ncbi:hypothetical protein [Streptomyces sp. NBC_01438]|uniref:hypothetical protein n=1 Tax=Streptomyces sp. NBC_01438 TaxID=2903866 RepID=UPI0032539D56